MTTGATGQLGLALPVQGELSGTWGDTVNNGITQYTNIAIAATLTLTNDGAVTLANTTGDASASNIVSTLTGAGTVTAQFAIVRVTGTLTTAKVVTAPSYSKTYVVVNAATGGIVTFKASGQTGVSIAVGESAWVYFNGTDYVKLAGTVNTGVTSFQTSLSGLTPSTSTTGAVTLAGTLGTSSGGTGLTSFTSGGVVYASSTSALATGSALTFDGSNLSTTGQVLLENNKYIGFKNTTGTYAASIFNDTSNFLNFYNSGNTGTIFYVNAAEQMRLTSTGLGIGTSSPSTKLDIAGLGANTPAAIFRGGVGVGNSGGLGLYTNATDANARNWYLASNSVSNGDFNIRVGASQGADPTGGTSVATFSSAGNVGIGITSPSAKLSVGGALGQSTFGEAARFISTSVDSGSKITFYGKQGSDASEKLSGAIGFNQTNNADSNGQPAFIIQTGNNGTITEKVRVTYLGGLSVGTTADPGAGAIYATGNITAYYSDARLKTVSGKIENALDKVGKLSGVYYTNNDTAKSFGYDSDEEQVGVIAQEVEAVLPQIVKAAPFDLDENNNSKSGENYKTVQYDKLVPLLIEAINELQAKVKALEAK